MTLNFILVVATQLRSIPCYQQYQSIQNSILHAYGKLTVGESIASSAVKTSIDIDAKLIIVMSETGKMARYVAKFRPGKYETT